MTLIIEPFILGPLENNAFLLYDDISRRAAIIDPPIQGLRILDKVRELGCTLTHILITHAHFDHFATAVSISKSITPPVPLVLHPADLPIWRSGGGAAYFGIDIDNSVGIQRGQVTQCTGIRPSKIEI